MAETSKSFTGGIRPVTDNLSEIAKNITTNSMGFSTSLPSLDNQIRGLQPGELTIIAGRSSMGKSSLVIGIALEISNHENVIMFSLEMNHKIVAERSLVNLADADYHNIKLGYATPDDHVRLDKATGQLSSRKLFIDDSSFLTPMLLKKKLKSCSVRFGCVIIDYLQLMRPSNPTGNLVQELDDICQSLKGIAKELNVPVIVASQLSRAPDQRENHEPRLSDLRSSGGIEQTADTVLLLHRPSYYAMKDLNVDSSQDNGEAHIIIAKARNGPTGRVKCVWLSESMKFVEPGFDMEAF